MYHIVYKTTNIINQKYYIGVHSTNNINDGYLGSGYVLKKAIKKYGIDNFIREILYSCTTKEEALQIEKIIVNESFIQNKNTYNLVSGGCGGDITFRKDKTYQEIYGEEKAKQLKELRVKESTGIIRSEETKEKMSIWQKGKSKPESMKEKLKNRKRTEETKEKLRYKKSDEHKIKISESHKFRELLTCEHCGKTMNKLNFVRWHGDKCKKASRF